MEARQVEKLALEQSLPFVLNEIDVPAYAKEHSLSLEAAARAIRYTFLFDLASEREAQAVAVGHTADDQVETILLHLLRGTGLSGLKGMEYRTLPNTWSQEIPLIRPLLGVWRADVLAYLNERGLQPVDDLSNLDVTYARNRVRHELIPMLETYNPGIRKALWRMGEIVKSDLSIVHQATDQAWASCVDEAGKGYLSFRVAEFRDQAQAVQRHLLLRGIYSFRPTAEDIDFALIERGIRFAVQAQPGSQVELAVGLRLFVELGNLWLADCEAELPVNEGWPQMATQQEVQLELPGTIGLSPGWEISTTDLLPIHERRDQIFNNSDPLVIWVDAERLALPLVVRGRRRGDRISPLGMDGQATKISDLMINQKIPRRARELWPVLCDQQEVIWIPGLRLSNRAQVGNETKWVIQIAMHKHITR